MGDRIGDFDAQAFYEALDSTRRARGDMPWRAVAKEAGISPSTLTRMAQGKRPDVDSLAALTTWSGLSADQFVRRHDPTRRSESLGEISALLRADANLSEEAAGALEDILRATYARLRT